MALLTVRQVTFANHEGMDEGVAVRKVEASSPIDSVANGPAFHCRCTINQIGTAFPLLPVSWCRGAAFLAWSFECSLW